MHRLKILFYCTALLTLVLRPLQVQARELFRDEFQNDSLENWMVVRNLQWGNESKPCYFNGSPALWQIILQRLGIEISGPGCFTEIVPKNFQLTGSEGYSFEFDMTMPVTSQMDRNYTLRYVDANNEYGIHILDNQIFFEKAAQGRGWSVPGSRAYYPFVADQAYHVKNELSEDHTIKVYINDQLVLNFVDPEPYVFGGTIGFRASVGSIPYSVVWFDNAVVNTLSGSNGTQLDVPYFSQRDDLWKNIEYDTAHIWSPSDDTIESWGCALTSAVMVFRYHNILELEPGMDLTPKTLNGWLLAQPDGYIGSGYVNWLALARLSRNNHQLHPETPSLEFQRKTNSVEQLTEEITAEKPAILELNRHFVVARGIDDVKNSFDIHDPFYKEKTSLLDYNNEFKSFRSYTPSFTDLSYIMVVQSPSVHLQLANRDIPFEQQVEQMENDSTRELNDPLLYYQLAKPEQGEYDFAVTADSTTPFTLTFYLYSTEGEVQIETITGVADQQAQHFQLNYSSSSTSTITKDWTPSGFRETLMRYRTTNDIPKAYTYYSLLKLAQLYEEVQNENSRERYNSLITSTLMLYKQNMSDQAYSSLVGDLLN